MTNLAPVFRTAATAPPHREPQPQAQPTPAFGIAYFFPGGGTPPGDPNPVFDALRAMAAQAQTPDGDGDGHRRLEPVEASSRNETPEPPVPAPLPPQEPAPAPEPQPAGQPPQDGAQAASEPPAPKREPLPRGEAEKRALLFLAEHPDADYTPGQIAKAIDARGCRDLMARLAARGAVKRTNDKPLRYRAAQPKTAG